MEQQPTTTQPTNGYSFTLKGLKFKTQVENIPLEFEMESMEVNMDPNTFNKSMDYALKLFESLDTLGGLIGEKPMVDMVEKDDLPPASHSVKKGDYIVQAGQDRYSVWCKGHPGLYLPLYTDLSTAIAVAEALAQAHSTNVHHMDSKGKYIDKPLRDMVEKEERTSN